MVKHFIRLIIAVAIASLSVLAVSGIGFQLGAVSTQSLTRDPYVTDLTSSSAEINWGIAVPQVGSVVVQKANGVCPSTIPWSASAIGATTKDPLVNTTGQSPTTTTNWDYLVGTTTEYQESVDASGLSPFTTYCYAVFSSDDSSAVQLGNPPLVQSFTTLAKSGANANLTFDVIGDTGDDTGGIFNQGESNIYSEIGSSGAQFLMIAGDVGYQNGSETNYGDLTQTGSEVSDVFGQGYYQLANGIPTFVADGNHGQNSDDLRIWPTTRTVANDTPNPGTYAYGSPPAPSDPNGITNDSPSDWYAVQDGNVRIYVLDAAWSDGSAAGYGTSTGSLCGPVASHCQGYEADSLEHWQTDSTEYQWLKTDLAAHPGGVKMAVFHYPINSVNQTEVSDPYLTNLTDLLAKGGVQLVFNGHAHTYQRFSSPDFTSFVTGGGGGGLETVSNTGSAECNAAMAAYSVYALGWDPGSGVGSACGAGVPTPTAQAGGALQVFNYLKVTVDGLAVHVTAYNALGQAFDQASVTYPAGSSPPPLPPPPAPPPSNLPPPVNTPPPSLPFTGNGSLPTPVTGMASLPDGSGYWLTDAAGGVSAHGNSVNYGSMAGQALNAPINHIVATPDGKGYWLVAADGGTFAFGDAGFYGSTGGLRLNAPVVDIAPTADGKGYWLVASDGGIFAFGDAQFFGSMGGEPLNKPVVGMAGDVATGGYWLVATDGGIFAFNAPFFGSTGSIVLNKPVNGMAATADSDGYWFVASDGGIFAYGDAQFHGSTGSLVLNAPVVGMAANRSTGGYWLVASDGGIFAFGTPFYGTD